MATFQLNQPVRILFTTMTGTISGALVDQTTLEVQYKVDYVGNDGEPHSRYFKPDQIEAAA